MQGELTHRQRVIARQGKIGAAGEKAGQRDLVPARRLECRPQVVPANAAHGVEQNHGGKHDEADAERRAGEVEHAMPARPFATVQLLLHLVHLVEMGVMRRQRALSGFGHGLPPLARVAIIFIGLRHWGSVGPERPAPL